RPPPVSPLLPCTTLFRSVGTLQRRELLDLLGESSSLVRGQASLVRKLGETLRFDALEFHTCAGKRALQLVHLICSDSRLSRKSGHVLLRLSRLPHCLGDSADKRTKPNSHRRYEHAGEKSRDAAGHIADDSEIG